MICDKRGNQTWHGAPPTTKNRLSDEAHQIQLCIKFKVHRQREKEKSLNSGCCDKWINLTSINIQNQVTVQQLSEERTSFSSPLHMKIDLLIPLSEIAILSHEKTISFCRIHWNTIKILNLCGSNKTNELTFQFIQSIDPKCSNNYLRQSDSIEKSVCLKG